MFDDYVEHAAGPTAGLSQGAPPLRYEGFEPAPHAEEDLLDEGIMDESAASQQAPLFDLGRVQFTLPAPLVALAVASDFVAMGLASNIVLLIELAHADRVQSVLIPRKPLEFSIHKLFLDPSGRHLVVASAQGENWYYYQGWKKPKQLKSWKTVVESIAWARPALLASSSSTSTREMLVGARNGSVYEALLDAEEDFFKSQERYFAPVFALPDHAPVTGLAADVFPPTDPRRALVAVTTPSRFYQFVGTPERRADDGGGKVYANLFAAYRDAAPNATDLPSPNAYSELHYYNARGDQAQSLPQEMAWMTGLGVYHGTFNWKATGDNLVDNTQLFPYPEFPTPGMEMQDAPISMALTEFHFVLLYKDRIAAVSTLDEKLAYEEILPLKPGEEVRGITADPVRKTYWVYTDQSLFELVVGNEDRDVWKVYLSKGKFDTALRHAKTAAQRDAVTTAQAHAYFAEGRFFPAAEAYAKCSVTFEEVTLKFIDVGERDALRIYLIARLERTRRTDLSQRMMLATWLVEFFLSKCNELDDLAASSSASYDVENVRAERAIVEEDLRQFFRHYKDNLEPSTVYELIQGHGRTDMYLFYAALIGDHVRVVEHHVLEESWPAVLDVISRQQDVELYYRFASTLVRAAPRDTVDAWLRRSELDPLRLVPALLQLQRAPRDPLNPNQAARYLQHVVFEAGSTAPTIHNLLIAVLSAEPEGEAALLRFLAGAPADPLTGRPFYDLDYALRVCKEAGRVQPCVHIYAQMGLWESAVDLALEKGDVELAQMNADKPEDDPQLRKALWLKIAKFVVQDKQDIKMAMKFLENTDLLKIEDILPFFPDFVVIDDFKEEIAGALEGYSAQIDALKAEMDDATRAADAMKESVTALKNRFVTLDVGERCSQCALPLLTRQFYVFPCQHALHADCLIGLSREYLPRSALQRVLRLQTELLKAHPGALDRGAITHLQAAASAARRDPLGFAQSAAAAPARTLMSAGGGLGRNLLSAGDRLRDLIVPDALASVVAAPVGWIPGMGAANGNGTATPGGRGTARAGVAPRDAQRAEKLRAELEDILAAACPLCESVIAGLDKPFIKEGEGDEGWEL